MSSYYYLMAQLPAILTNAPLPITYKTFKETASRFLTSNDQVILDRLSIESPRKSVKTGSSVVDGYYRFDRALRISLGRLRAAKLKRTIEILPEEDDLVTSAFETIQIARTAATFDNPLEAEWYLIHAARNVVENLRGNHFFDSDAVFAYGLMLLLRERSDHFTAEAGRASYTTIYNKILGE